jgi:hypothetical protein
MKHIKATTDHPFTDPVKTRMKTRVGRGPSPGWYIFVWERDGVGWRWAKTDAEAQELLNLEPQPSTR